MHTDLGKENNRQSNTHSILRGGPELGLRRLVPSETPVQGDIGVRVSAVGRHLYFIESAVRFALEPRMYGRDVVTSLFIFETCNMLEHSSSVGQFKGPASFWEEATFFFFVL